MTIACTRCGATEDGDIILPPIAFKFKHNLGCGHGVGPLAVLPGSSKKKPDTSIVESVKQVFTDTKKEVKVEEKLEKAKHKSEKTKVFGKKD